MTGALDQLVIAVSGVVFCTSAALLAPAGGAGFSVGVAATPASHGSVGVSIAVNGG